MPKASTSQLRQTSVPSDLEIDGLHLSGRESHDEQPPSPKTAAIMRRRKNADAQAAFRARRANYIANLEETGPCQASFPSPPRDFYFFSS